MEGYAADELVARAEAVEAGLGVLVGALVGLVGELTGAQLAAASFDRVEQVVAERGRELLRMVVQHVLDVAAGGERRLAGVTGVDGVPRTWVERGHCRTVVSSFGPVTIRRLAYRAAGQPNLHPRDAALNLPPRRYSWRVQRMAVEYALAGSYEQAQRWLRAAMGISIGKQQLEQIVVEAARDAPGCYPAAAAPAPCPPGAPLALPVDGKGVAMRPEARRRRAKAPAQRAKTFGKRLGTGEKTGHKRLAHVGAVFDVIPPDRPRTPEQIMNRAPGDPPAAQPRAARRWYTVDIAAGRAATIRAVFDEAARRDPARQRDWIALVDGDSHQIATICQQASQRGVTVTILVDLIHVLEYLWKAAWCFHPARDPAAETWVTTQALAILHGRVPEVIGLINDLAPPTPPNPAASTTRTSKRPCPTSPPNSPTWTTQRH